MRSMGLRALTICGAISGFALTGNAYAVTSYHLGTECTVTEGPFVGYVIGLAYGILASSHPTQYMDVSCPVTKTAGTVATTITATVNVVDQHATDNVGCGLESRNGNSINATQFFYNSAGTGNKTITFSMPNNSGQTPGTSSLALRCFIPKVGQSYSGIGQYKITY